ncbi:MAG: Nicotinate-nucleotide adenylyltransferase [Fimbriimonadaceae bacterium]|nr:Nicotinate-nucleotide adenylyltransferase [Fimbriimonadaceae bacterium]
MRIGVFGGSFDPPHLGHLQLAKAVRTSLELDEVVFVPAFRSPFKQSKGHATPKQRQQMVELLIRDQPGLSLSDIEISRKGFSYTVETLTELTLSKPGDYWLLLGSDSAMGLGDWKQPLRLAQLARFAVVMRPPHRHSDVMRRLPEALHDKVDFVDMKANPISSTEIRDLIHHCRPITRYVTAEVAEYIEANKLYKD